MKNNNSLFRKAYNNHHDRNGSDVSSTSDGLMRSDIGDGINLDGENFRNANGDDFNSDVVYEDDAGLQWNAAVVQFFIQEIYNNYGCNANVDLDAINLIVGQHLQGSSAEGMLGNPEFLGELRAVYMYACGLNPATSDTDSMPDGDPTVGGISDAGVSTSYDEQGNPIQTCYLDGETVDCSVIGVEEPSDGGNMGGSMVASSCDDLIGMIQSYNNSNVLTNTPPPPATPVEGPYETAPGGNYISNYMTALGNSDFGTYLDAVIYSILCSAGYQLGVHGDEQSWLVANDCPLDVGYNQQPGTGSTPTSADLSPMFYAQEYVNQVGCVDLPNATNYGNSYSNFLLSIGVGLEGIPQSFFDIMSVHVHELCGSQVISGGGMSGGGEQNIADMLQTDLAEDEEQSITDVVPNEHWKFSNANGDPDNTVLITALNNIRNYIATHPINLRMHSAFHDLQDQGMYGDSYYPTEYSSTTHADVYNYIKVAELMEFFIEMVVMTGNCLPTGVKSAMDGIILESIARNTKFLDIETDYVSEILDNLNISHPPNIFTEYTSLEYNELANQLAASEGMIADTVAQIDSLNGQIMILNAELNSAFELMDDDQAQTAQLQSQVMALHTDIATLETQLMGTMTGLAQMQNDFVNVVEENGILQAELGASQVLISTLQTEFDNAVMNELNLQSLVTTYENTLASRDADIASLQAQLGLAISNLANEMAIGDNMQTALQTQLANSNSEIAQLTSQIAGLQASLSIAQGQLEDNTINDEDVAYYENQISSLVQTNQALVNTLHEMELQTGQTSADLGSGVVDVQGRIDMKTGRGTIQLLQSRPKTPAKIREVGRKLRFVANNPKKDLNPWNYMDGEHRRFNNSYDLDN